MALCDAKLPELGHRKTGKGHTTPIQVALTLQLRDVHVDIFETHLFLNNLVEETTAFDLAKLVGKDRVGKLDWSLSKVI